MRLKIKKCKVVFTPGKDAEKSPSLSIKGYELEVVESYRYLGIAINNKLDWSQQWDHIAKVTSHVPYLIKQLKRLGFNKAILVTVYKSLAVSHLDYNSPVLLSTTNEIKTQINNLQKRILRIIGINQTDAHNNHNLIDPNVRIEDMSKKKVSKLLSDPNNSVSQKYRNVDRSNSDFNFKTKPAKTKIYNESIVQKCIRTLRDDEVMKNLYKLTKPNKNIRIKEQNGNTEKPKVQCQNCGSSYEAKIGIKTHLRTCQVKKTNQNQFT